MTWLEMFGSVTGGLISQVNSWFHAWLSGNAITNYAFVPVTIVGLCLASFAFYMIRRILF